MIMVVPELEESNNTLRQQLVNARREMEHSASDRRRSAPDLDLGPRPRP